MVLVYWIRGAADVCYAHPCSINQVVVESISHAWAFHLCSAGARAFHFRIYYDPTGKLYQTHAGLAIVNQSANTTADDPKWAYPGK